MSTKQLKAAIYNRWLFTLGGGEQVTFAYAEALRDLGYETTILTHKQVDLQAAKRKMNVDLKNINIEYIPLLPSYQLSLFSEKYSVFINTSYLDYFPNRSQKGLLSVFFPGEIHVTLWEYLKRGWVVPSLQKFFIYPTQYEGFIGDQYKNRTLFKWLGKSSKISISNTAVRKLSIELYFPTFGFSLLESLSFTCNGTPLTPSRRHYLAPQNTLILSFETKEPIREFVIKKSKGTQFEVALKRLTIPHIKYSLYNFFKLYFPKWEMRLHGGSGVTPISDLKSYHKIITISRFCQYWIQQYWGLPSEILYPPVNTHAFKPMKTKKNWITHIGRFFVTGHSKKQLELIRVFKKLMDQKQLDSSWELHFIGSVHEGPTHQQYFEACQYEAQGYPIHFHIGIPFTELKKILEQSKVYWHATGLDEDPTQQPILMEHFGITTVEAMAAGCVPVVINAGGQPEIITSGTGFIWSNRAELQKYTIQLAKDETLRKKMMQKALKRSQDFSKEAFTKRFKLLMNQVD